MAGFRCYKFSGVFKGNQENQDFSGNQKNVIQEQRLDMENKPT